MSDYKSSEELRSGQPGGNGHKRGNKEAKSPPPVPPALKEAFLAWLPSYGLTPKQADDAGIEPSRARAISKWTGFHTNSDGVLIRYLDGHGEDIPDPLDPGHPLYRVRLFELQIATDGKPVKYLARDGGGWGIYEPSNIDYSSDLLVITEGELKALRAALLKIPVVGIAGVWMFTDPLARQAEKAKAAMSGKDVPITADTPLLHRLIELCQGKHVLVIFDADGAENPSVRHALAILEAALRKQTKAQSVQVALIPPEAGVNGLDDWINKDGGPRECLDWLFDILTNPQLYLPSLAEAARHDPSKLLYVVDSPEKAEDLDRKGYYCASLTGWRSWITDGGVLANVDKVDWINRVVRLCPDSQVWTQPERFRALYALGKELTKNRGAEVQIIKLPSGSDGQNVIFSSDWLNEHASDVDQFLLKPPRNKSVLEHSAFSSLEVWWKGWEKREGVDTSLARDASDQRSSIEGMPPGFRLTERGVERAEVGARGRVHWIKICSPLEVIALTSDENGFNWGRLLRFKDPDGKRHDWAMPMSSMAADGVAYRAPLLEAGLEIEPERFARDNLHTYITTSRPPDRVRNVSRLGWHGNIFVMPEVALGEVKQPFVFQDAQYLTHAFHNAGTIEEWRANVASLCAGNSRLVLGICLAFAGPLLGLTHDESGGLHLVGMSSTGKTTALVVAGSVWGGGGLHGYLQQWRATANALESVAALHCDTLLCLDEISQISSKEAGEVAYMLANGQGKRRARPDGSGRVPLTWRLLFLSSGELTLADKIEEDGRSRPRAGQAVRVVDVPAVIEASPFGLFENIHGVEGG